MNLKANIKKHLNEAIKDCKKARKGLSEYDHDRIDLEGKIYAYEYVRDCILGGPDGS